MQPRIRISQDFRRTQVPGGIGSVEAESGTAEERGGACHPETMIILTSLILQIYIYIIQLTYVPSLL